MNVREAIQILAKTNDEIYSKICRVDTVDLEKRICDVTAMDGTGPYLEMRLQPIEGFGEGVLLVPEIGSLVIVTFFSEVEAYVACGTQMRLVEVRMNDLVLELHRGDESKEERPYFSLKSGKEEEKETLFRLDDTNITIQKKNGKANCPMIQLEEHRIALENGDASIVLEEDKVKFNRGKGQDCFTKGNKVLAHLQQVENEINDLKKCFQKWVPAPMDGGTALYTALSDWTNAPLLTVATDDICDKDIID